MLTERMPQVSVVVPVYDGERLGVVSLRLLGAQSLRPTEVVVVPRGIDWR